MPRGITAGRIGRVAVSSSTTWRGRIGPNPKALDRAHVLHVSIPKAVQLASPRAFNIIHSVTEDCPVLTNRRVNTATFTTPAMSGAAVPLTVCVRTACRRDPSDSGESTSAGSPHPGIEPPGLSAPRAGSREYGPSCGLTSAPLSTTTHRVAPSDQADHEQNNRKYCCHDCGSIPTIVGRTPKEEMGDVPRRRPTCVGAPRRGTSQRRLSGKILMQGDTTMLRDGGGGEQERAKYTRATSIRARGRRQQLIFPSRAPTIGPVTCGLSLCW